jgi:hypothetical protein
VTGELGPEVEAELKALRKAMRKALRAGDMAAYGRAKGEHVTRVHEAQRRAQRAAREALRAPVPEPVRSESGRWRLPFRRSPLAYERDRQPPAPVAPQLPRGGHLSPWRRGGSPASEVIWRP